MIILVALLLIAATKFCVSQNEGYDLNAPWFGADPSEKTYNLHRRGWDACLRCGGSDRLGAIVNIGDSDESLDEIDEEGVREIIDAVRAHGMIVIKGQNLTRAQQVEFTDKLGDVVVLPSSFEGQDPEPFQPAIQRITNFWADGTWKGQSAKFGAYWHQDGQFWIRPKHNLLSILHAQATPPEGGETGFADLRAARATLSRSILDRAANASIRASVRDIGDFASGLEEDLLAFPEATHAILDNHALDGGPILYVGSPHMTVDGLKTPEAGKALLKMLLAHCVSPAFTYFHSWDVGDVVIWDNTQTLHHAMPYDNDGTAHRELYRTQSRLRLPKALITHEDETKNNNEEL